ncbi:MAG: AgmX/PglI C-terminal domain-containing protein [Myxococcota bacterium]
MFCQACGAKVTEDALFCSMCGVRIAAPGTPGGRLDGGGPAGSDVAGGQPDDPGPLSQIAQEVSHERGAREGIDAQIGSAPKAEQMRASAAFEPSMLGVSLAGIGVQSSARAWTTVVLIGVSLFALGAAAAWLAMGSSEEAVGRADPEDPFVLGAPVPAVEERVAAALEVPEAPAEANPELRSSAATTKQSRKRAGPTKRKSAVISRSRKRRSTASKAAQTPRTQPEAAEEPAEAAEEPVETVDAQSAAPDEERELEMELYSARVRYSIRRYYTARAQRCFDQATQSRPTLSGTVVVDFTIGADGYVTRSAVGRNTTGDDALGACLANQVRGFRLPSPPSGSVSMHMPFSR